MANDTKQTAASAAPKVVHTAAAAAEAAPSAAAAMPAGDERREKMKKDLAALQEMQESFATEYGPELGAIDPAKLKHVDNEIGQYADRGLRHDGSEVEGALPDYVYRWEEARGNNGVAVEEAKYLGWRVVESGPEFPEEKRRLSVDGTRRWGTTILMRMPRDRALELAADDRRRVLSRTEGVSLNVLVEAERRGIKIHDVTSEKTPAHMRRFASAQRAAAEAARSTMVSSMRQAGRDGAQRELAASLADKRFEAALRSGTVPGL